MAELAFLEYLAKVVLRREQIFRDQLDFLSLNYY